MYEFVIMTKCGQRRIVNPCDDKLMRLCLHQGYMPTGYGVDDVPPMEVETEVQAPVLRQLGKHIHERAAVLRILEGDDYV